MIELLMAECKRTWLMFKYYPTEAIGLIFILTSLFYGLILGIHYVTESSLSFGNKLDSLIVGYVLWTLVAFTTGDIPIGIQNEAQLGILDQVFLSPFGALKVYLIRAIAGLSLNLVLVLCILFAILAVTRSHIQFSPSLLLPLFSVILGAIGLAFALAALALLVKRIQRLHSILEFVLLFLLTAPTETWSGLLKALGLLLPMTPGTGMLRAVVVRGEPLDPFQLVLALLNGVVYLAIGMLLFQWSENYAKRRGILSTH